MGDLVEARVAERDALAGKLEAALAQQTASDDAATALSSKISSLEQQLASTTAEQEALAEKLSEAQRMAHNNMRRLERSMATLTSERNALAARFETALDERKATEATVADLTTKQGKPGASAIAISCRR